MCAYSHIYIYTYKHFIYIFICVYKAVDPMEIRPNR